MEISPLVFDRKALFSQVAKEVLGEKVVDIWTTLTQEKPPQDDGNGGLIDFIFNTGKKLIGFALGAITSIGGWALSRLRDWFVSGLLTFYTFDWAQTDKALESQMEQNNVAIIQSLGDLVGSSAVWLGSIAIAGAATFKFPVIAGTTLLKLAEEGGQEFRTKIQSLLNVTVSKQAENWIIRCFLTARRLKFFGQQPINEQKDPWIISDQIERRIDQVDNPLLKGFLNGLKNGIEDAVLEAIYVVSFGIEEAYRASKLSLDRTTGKEKLIELMPDDRLDDEKIVLRGKSEELKPIVMNALGTSKLVRNREIGQFVGVPLADYVKANPLVRKLNIIFKSVQKPPFREGGNRAKQVICNIPDVKMGLTWEEIKQAAQPFEWGKYRCSANLKNGRQMVIYGASPSEAEQTLRRLLTLSTAEILTLSITEEKDRNIKLRKDAKRVYPAFATLLTRQPDLDDPQYTDLEGKGYAEYTQRLELYHDAKPEGLEPLR